MVDSLSPPSVITAPSRLLLCLCAVSVSGGWASDAHVACASGNEPDGRRAADTQQSRSTETHCMQLQISRFMHASQASASSASASRSAVLCCASTGAAGLRRGVVPINNYRQGRRASVHTPPGNDLSIAWMFLPLFKFLSFPQWTLAS